MSSPPTFLTRASRPDIMPLLVEIIEIPKPLSTFGILFFGANALLDD